MARRELVEWFLSINAGDAAGDLDDLADRAKRLKDEAARVDRGFDSMGRGGQKVANMLGGPFGDLADIVFDLGEASSGASSAIGVMGGAALGAVVGVAALTYAGVELASAADAAAKRLEEAGLAALIPPESQASVDRYREATGTLRTEADLLTVSLGGPALDAVSAMSEMLAGAALRLRQVDDAATGAIGKLESLASVMPDRPAWVDYLDMALGAGLTGGSTLALGIVQDTAAWLQKSGEAAKEAHDEVKSAGMSELAIQQAINEAAAEEARRKKSAEDATRKLAQARAEAARQAQKEAAATKQRTQTIEELTAAMRGFSLGEIPAIDLSGVVGAAGMSGPDLSGFGSLDSNEWADRAAEKRDRLSSGIGAVADIAGGGLGGVSSLLAAAGPIGAAISAGINLGPIVDGLGGLMDSIIDLVTDLPGIVTTLLTEVVPGILAAVPELVTAIIDTIGQLPAILIEAIPEILGSLATLLLELPQILTTELLGLLQDLPGMIYDGTKQLISDLWAQLQGLPMLIWEGLKGALGIGDRKYLGTDLTGAKGERSLFGISFDSGSREITRTGMAMLHRGEEVTRKAYRGRGSGTPATINVYGPDTREIVRQVHALLGGSYGPSYGTGDSL